MGSQSGWGAAQSKEFLDLVRSIGEARSKAEEDRIVLREIESLRSRINSPDVPRRKMKEYLIRLIYVEMLGHDASFGYIHAVKMTHDDSLPIKRTGYLAVTLFLSDAHDLIILIVNTIQKDLRSDNYLVVSAALSAACKLIADEAIPAVLPLVVDLLAHPKETVRKKAVMVLHCFHHRSPSSVSHLLSNFRKKLCDNDPGVMSASLCPLLDLIKEDPNAYKDLVMSFVSILKQVAERRLPKTYDYHQMPAPFIQIKLLKILALLGSNDKQASEGMYTVLGDIFRKSEQSTNIGNAVLYECICCVSAIHPNPKILKTAAEVTSQFLKNDSHNLKYMGIDALGRLFKINPEIAEEHQLLVIDCLEDPDDTLKRKTFDLLYKMTKSSNVEVIVERMIDYMINITDEHYKTEIASRCVELAEQFAPSNHWFIQTMNKVFEHAGDLVNPRVTHNLMRLIAEGFGEDDDGADSQLRSSAVDSYLHILGEPKLPSIFLQVICWVLGEYGTADGKYSASYINGKLCDVAEAHSNDDIVKAYAITAILKISAFEIAAGRGVELLPECQTLIDELLASHSTDLQQRAYELQALLGLGSQAIENIMPFDASCEDIEVDKSLPFLDGFVQQCLLNGARPYSLESERSTVLDNSKSEAQQDVSSHALRFEAYELPKPSLPKTPVPLTPVVDLVPVSESTYAKETTQTLYGQPAAEALSGDSGVKLHLDGVQKKWGRPTYSSSSVPSMPASNTEKTTNGASNPNIGGTVTIQARDSSYDSASQKVEASEEKQKLAASLFGSSSSKTGRRTASSSKSTKGATSTPTKAVAQEPPTEKVQAMPPPPDLLDLGDLGGSASVDVPQKDPFEQLEGLVGSNAAAAPTNSDSSAAKEPSDLLSLLEDAPVAAAVMSTGGETPAIISSSGLNKESTSGGTSNSMFPKKGPNRVDSLEKDAVARQVGVTPTTNNPNLFSDLLG